MASRRENNKLSGGVEDSRDCLLVDESNRLIEALASGNLPLAAKGQMDFGWFRQSLFKPKRQLLPESLIDSSGKDREKK